LSFGDGFRDFHPIARLFKSFFELSPARPPFKRRRARGEWGAGGPSQHDRFNFGSNPGKLAVDEFGGWIPSVGRRGQRVWELVRQGFSRFNFPGEIFQRHTDGLGQGDEFRRLEWHALIQMHGQDSSGARQSLVIGGQRGGAVRAGR
jgi:hypothetical protein